METSWDNGLPTGGTTGVIATASANFALRAVTGYTVTQSGGDLFTSGGSNTLTSTQWTLNGGTLRAQSIGLAGGSTFTVNNGTYRADATGGDLNVTDSTLNIFGGSVIAPDDFTHNNGNLTITSGTLSIGDLTNFSNNAQFTISGGAFSTGGVFGGQFGSTNGDAFFNGGTSVVGSLGFGSANFTVNLGGTNPGTLTAAGFIGTASNRRINWTFGSSMELTITGADEWASSEWNAGRMTFDGSDFNTLGDWSTVKGTIFLYDSDTETLSLVPEPSSFAIYAGALVLLVASSRRSR